MDEQPDSLCASDGASRFSGFGLRRLGGARTPGPFGLHTPARVARENVNITLCHARGKCPVAAGG